MDISHGCFDRFMAHYMLEKFYVHAVFQQMGGEGVAQGVACGIFGYSRFFRGPFHDVLKCPVRVFLFLPG